MSTSAMSSLSRAFTTKRSKNADGNGVSSLQRSFTTKATSSTPPARLKISAPVELLSTTNMLSYNAPDILAVSRSRSSSSGSETDGSANSPSSVSTAVTTPDNASIESSPSSPKPNHLSCYFGAPSVSDASSEEAPKIPQRVPSHTKKSAEAIARRRSSSRLSSKHNSLSSGRSSLNTPVANVEAVAPHPFGNELAQVSELAEEFGIPAQKLEITDPEEQELLSRGFFKFCAEDYWNEISGFFEEAYGAAKSRPRPIWI